MTKLPKRERLLITIQLEDTLNGYCRAGCPHAFSNTISPTCSQCPINHRLRDFGRVLSPDKVIKPKPPVQRKVREPKPPVQRKYTTWTEELGNELISLSESGMTYREIAEHFGFTRDKIIGRTKRLRKAGRISDESRNIS